MEPGSESEFDSDGTYLPDLVYLRLLKSHAAEVLRELAESGEPMLITQNGEARAVIQDVASYEETQETLALLEILALGNQEIERGDVTTVEDAVSRLRARRRAGGWCASRWCSPPAPSVARRTRPVKSGWRPVIGTKS
jgi:prevent-host-death family protein